jgi:hypothetical protein
MLREWMFTLIKNFESEEMGLFKKCETNELAFTISSDSIKVSKWANKFSLLGRIIGKALFERIPLNLCFAFPIYKAILEEFIDFHDIKYLDTAVIF